MALQPLRPTSQCTNSPEGVPHPPDVHPDSDCPKAAAVKGTSSETADAAAGWNQSKSVDQTPDESQADSSISPWVTLGPSCHDAPTLGVFNIPLASASMPLESSEGISNLEGSKENLVERQNAEGSISTESHAPSDLETISHSGTDPQENGTGASQAGTGEMSRIQDDSDRSEDQISILRPASTHPSLDRQRPDQPERAILADSQGDRLFRAFPRSRWVRSVTIATLGFVIMTLMVLGNLIYTYVT